MKELLIFFCEIAVKINLGTSIFLVEKFAFLFLNLQFNISRGNIIFIKFDVYSFFARPQRANRFHLFSQLKSSLPEILDNR